MSHSSILFFLGALCLSFEEAYGYNRNKFKLENINLQSARLFLGAASIGAAPTVVCSSSSTAAVPTNASINPWYVTYRELSGTQNFYETQLAYRRLTSVAI